MAPLGRRNRIPRAVKESLDLRDGDRVIATAELAEGWAVAGLRRLHVVADDGMSLLARPWSDVDGARLDPETAELSVSWVDGSPVTTLTLVDTRGTAFPRAVRERVQSSVVHSERVVLPSGVALRVVLRRASDGHLMTQVLGPSGVDLAEPGTAAVVDEAEARVREAAGLP